MFEMEKIYPLYFFVKHLGTYSLKEVFPREICTWRQLSFFLLRRNCSWGQFSPLLPRGSHAFLPKGTWLELPFCWKFPFPRPSSLKKLSNFIFSSILFVEKQKKLKKGLNL